MKRLISGAELRKLDWFETSTGTTREAKFSDDSVYEIVPGGVLVYVSPFAAMSMPEGY